MNVRSCPQQTELSRLLHQGAWPAAASAELRRHVAGCAACAAEVRFSEGFRALRAESVAVPHLPSAGQIWWRAQLRRRREASERLRKPLLGAQIFALLAALVAAVGLLVWLRSTGATLAGWPAELARVLNPVALLPTSHGLWLLLPALAAVAAVGGAVAWLAIEKR